MIQLPIDPMVTFTRSTIGQRFNASGAIEAVAIDALRLDHDPASLNEVGLLVEAAATELNIESAITTTNWTIFGSPTVTYLTLGALGVFPGARVTSGGVDTHRLGLKAGSAIACTSGLVYQLDFYYRAGTSGRLRFAAQDDVTANTCRITGAIGSLAVAVQTAGTLTLLKDTLLADGLTRRLQVEFTPNFTGTFRVYAGPDTATAGQDVILLGLFVRQELTQGSPILTTGSTLVRGSDFPSINDGAWFNGLTGSVFVDFIPPTPLPPAILRVLQFDDGTDNNRLTLRVQSGALRLTVTRDGVDTAELNGGPVTAGVRCRAAFAYGAADYAISVDGAAPVVATSGQRPSGINRFHLGRKASAQFLNGWIDSLVYWQTRLTDAELQAEST